MRGREVLRHATLVFLVTRDRKVWLALKTKKVGAGRRNGYGGMVKEGETPAACALRELTEESGVRGYAGRLEKRCVIDFHTLGVPFVYRVHVFLLFAWDGEPKETCEMRSPQAYPHNALPFGEMMPADSSWMPRIFLKGCFYAEVWYNSQQTRLTRPIEYSPFLKGFL